MSITASPSTSIEIEFGNAGSVETNNTGWFIGFSEWSKSGLASLRHMPENLDASGLCVKWFFHAKGDPNGEQKPISKGRTISLLVGAPSEFRLEFSRSISFEPSETNAFVLREPGDFAIWGPGIYHRAFGLQNACLLTIRWLPKS